MLSHLLSQLQQPYFEDEENEAQRQRGFLQDREPGLKHAELCSLQAPGLCSSICGWPANSGWDSQEPHLFDPYPFHLLPHLLVVYTCSLHLFTAHLRQNSLQRAGCPLVPCSVHSNASAPFRTQLRYLLREGPASFPACTVLGPSMSSATSSTHLARACWFEVTSASVYITVCSLKAVSTWSTLRMHAAGIIILAPG